MFPLLLFSAFLTFGIIVLNSLTLNNLYKKGISKTYASIFMTSLAVTLSIASIFTIAASFSISFKYPAGAKLKDWDRSELGFIFLAMGNLMADAAGLFAILSGISVMILLKAYSRKLERIGIGLIIVELSSFALCIAAEISFITSFYKGPNESPELSGYLMIPFGIFCSVPQVFIGFHLHSVIWSKKSNQRQAKFLGRLSIISSIMAVPSLIYGFYDGYTGEVMAFSATTSFYLLAFLFYSITVFSVAILVFYGGMEISNVENKPEITKFSGPTINASSKIEIEKFQVVSKL